MARRQSKEQKETIERVMHEFKHGELETGTGAKVRNPRQAIAIALHEAGATNQESPADNKRNLRKTKAKERRGETAQAEKEGKAAQDRTLKKATARKPARQSTPRKSDLYAEARKRDVPGRSRMSKSELERALRH